MPPHQLLPAQAMRAAGILPAFQHLRSICNYPDARFDDWLVRLAPAAATASAAAEKAVAPAAPTVIVEAPISAADSNLSTAAALPGTLPRGRGRQLRGAGDNARPSVRADSLAELGVSYAVSPRPAGGVAADDAESGITSDIGLMESSQAGAAEERGAFAPGRTDGKALVRRVSRGLEVLDLYCGTGGFALNAAVGGARSVLGVSKRFSLSRVMRSVAG